MAKTASWRVDRPCEYCAVAFMPRYKGQRFCGGSCSAKQTARVRGQHPPQELACAGCSKPFVAFAGNDRKFCSVECSSAERRTMRPRCVVCGGRCRLMRNRYCSKSCSNRAERRGFVRIKLPGSWFERNRERHNAYQRRRYHMDPVYRAKALAQSLARRAHPVARPCEQCGDPCADRHHDDYGKPTEIRWLCRGCHIRHHVTQYGTWGSGLRRAF